MVPRSQAVVHRSRSHQDGEEKRLQVPRQESRGRKDPTPMARHQSVERWEMVEEFPDYAVSNRGRVKRLTPASGTQVGRVLQPQKRGGNNSDHRYLYVTLCCEGRKQSRAIHRLVAETFLPNDTTLPEVNHRNPLARFDNSVSNLEWASFADNSAHAVQHGRYHRPRHSAKHIYRHYGKWRVVVQGVSHGTFNTRRQAKIMRDSILSQKAKV